MAMAAFAIGQEISAVPQVEKGTFVIDANTTISSIGGIGFGGNGTGFLLTTSDGETIWNIGFEAGYFVDDRFALKLGLGFGEIFETTIFSYKAGAKYYIIDVIPVQLDISGQTSEDFGDEKPLYLGIQAGYAFMIGDMVSIEPSLRYSFGLPESYDNLFQIQVGFSLFF